MNSDDEKQPAFPLFAESDTESEEDLVSLTGQQLSQAVVFATDWTTETILRQLEKGNISLEPGYQRRDAWRGELKSRFIESLVLGLPIPQLVFAELKEKRGKYIVIDGKQRLLTLRQFAAKQGDAAYTPLKLSGLTIRSELNGKSMSDLENDFPSDLAEFQNQTIRTVILRNWPTEDFLYLVFLRLNTGTVKLSPQELRQALHPGKFVTFTVQRSVKSEGLQRFLKIDQPDFRMRDVELLVRYYAFRNFVTDYSGNLKLFLDTTCKTLNDRWEQQEATLKSQADDLDAAMAATFTIFGDDNAFRKSDGQNYQARRNRAVFDIMVYYFAQTSIRDAALAKAADVEAAFRNLCGDNDFLRSIESTTKSTSATKLRPIPTL